MKNYYSDERALLNMYLSERKSTTTANEISVYILSTSIFDFLQKKKKKRLSMTSSSHINSAVLKNVKRAYAVASCY